MGVGNSTNDAWRDVPRYPLLEALLHELGLALKGRYTTSDVAEIFGVSRRTIEKLQASGKLKRRNLPGHAKCLSQDLEEFLQSSESSQGTNGGSSGNAE